MRAAGPSLSRAGGPIRLVGFSDDRRLVVVRVVAIVLGGIVVVVVGISGRHRVAHDGDAPATLTERARFSTCHPEGLAGTCPPRRSVANRRSPSLLPTSRHRAC